MSGETPNAYDELAAVARARLEANGDVLVGRQDIAARIRRRDGSPSPVNTVDTWIAKSRRGEPADPAARFPNPLMVVSGTPVWLWSAVKAWAVYTHKLPPES